IIVIAVLLFFALGVAIMMVIDHKARISGSFRTDPFSIKGMRRDHPGIAFVTGTIMLCIIAALAASLLATMYESLRPKEPASETLLSLIEEDRLSERTRHFHNYPEAVLPEQGNKSACFYCHGDYPHSKEPMVRTMMNMHSQFVGCMTCHNDDEKIAESTLRFAWLNYSGIEVSGKPFGTDIDSGTGEPVATDDFYSKIVAYSDRELLEIVPDDPRTMELEAVYREMSDQDREAVKERFHGAVRANGRDCEGCHTATDSYLPFAELGFSARRQQDLENLPIAGLIEKYNRFFMPDLLGPRQPGRDREARCSRTCADESRSGNRPGLFRRPGPGGDPDRGRPASLRPAGLRR
ncbi:MAG: cytochrome c3 family protein, partial [Gammaproteobacteria bacterium]